MALFHPGDVDAEGWLFFGLFLLVVVGPIVFIIFLLLVPEKKRGEKANVQNNKSDQVDEEADS